MSEDELLRGSCSCGRYNYAVYIPADDNARSQARVHFGTRNVDNIPNTSLLSAWLKVPLTWYQSATTSFFPDERHDHIARTFVPAHEPLCQRKFCGFCGSHISYWTEEPIVERDFMHVTLGSLRTKDLLALEDLELLPTPLSPGSIAKQVLSRDEMESEPSQNEQTVLPVAAETGIQTTTRSGVTGGISWFEKLIEGSQLGHHSKTRRGQGTSADGTTTVSWEVSEYYDGGEEPEGSGASSNKRKAIEITTDDTQMKG